MSLPTFTKDMDIIAALETRPNAVGNPALSAAQLKAKFDEGGNAIKDFLNDTLTPAIESAIENLDGAAVKSVNGKTPDSSGEATVGPGDISYNSSSSIYEEQPGDVDEALKGIEAAIADVLSDVISTQEDVEDLEDAVEDLQDNTVRTDVDQELTDAQKTTARDNIDALPVEDPVAEGLLEVDGQIKIADEQDSVVLSVTNTNRLTLSGAGLPPAKVKLGGIQTPELANDASNKGYVDDAKDAAIAAIPAASNATPAALGTAAAGSSTDYARADHVHEKPNYAEIGLDPTFGHVKAEDVTLPGLQSTGDIKFENNDGALKVSHPNSGLKVKFTGLDDPQSAYDAVNKNYADTKYTKPGDGVPKTDLALGVQTSLGRADAAVQSPGTYDGLTVGLAKNLTTDVGTTDTAAYVSRTAPAFVGDWMKLRKIVGMTFGWNQLVKNGNFASTSNWTAYHTTISAQNNECTVAVGSGFSDGGPYQDLIVPAGHKILITCMAKCVTATKATILFQSASDTSKLTTATDFTELGLIASFTAGYGKRLLCRATGAGKTAVFKNICAIDLTALFGTTLADYIATLEAGSAGAGVAWVKRYLPKLGSGYYAYDPGSLQSVKASAHKTTDTDNVAHSYALDSTKEFRGLPTQDASGNLTADGDEYAPNGTVTRNYRNGELLIGTSWAYDSITNAFVGTALSAEVFPSPKEPDSNDDVGFAKILGFDTVSYNDLADDTTADNQIAIKTDGSIYIRADHTNTDVSAFTTAMASANILYKIATATTETAAAYTEDQVDGSGWTEEFVDAAVAAGTRDVAVPVGHQTLYPVNLRSRLEGLPDAPTSNGLYGLRVNNGAVSFEALSAWTGGSY